MQKQQHDARLQERLEERKKQKRASVVEVEEKEEKEQKEQKEEGPQALKTPLPIGIKLSGPPVAFAEAKQEGEAKQEEAKQEGAKQEEEQGRASRPGSISGPPMPMGAPPQIAPPAAAEPVQYLQSIVPAQQPAGVSSSAQKAPDAGGAGIMGEDGAGALSKTMPLVPKAM